MLMKCAVKHAGKSWYTVILIQCLHGQKVEAAFITTQIQPLCAFCWLHTLSVSREHSAYVGLGCISNHVFERIWLGNDSAFLIISELASMFFAFGSSAFYNPEQSAQVMLTPLSSSSREGLNLWTLQMQRRNQRQINVWQDYKEIWLVSLWVLWCQDNNKCECQAVFNIFIFAVR